MEEEIVIIGAGGYAKVIADAIMENGDEVVGFLDDDLEMQGKEIYQGKTVIGKISDVGLYKDYPVVIGIENNMIRRKLAEELECKWHIIIHPDATVSEDVIIGEGTVIMPGVIVNPGTIIGKHSIINIGATIDYDNNIGNFVSISAGVHLAGGVNIGDGTQLCTNAMVINNIFVEQDNIIGVGAVVTDNITDKNGTYVGVPIKRIK